MRIPIYPAVEEFIQSKKQNKYANLQKQTSNTDTSKKTTVKRGIKRKVTVEEKREKSAAKRSRAAASSSTSVLLCGSCNAEGHSSARSKLCLNYKFTLKDLIQRDIGDKHERYTISIPLKSFLNETNDNDQLGKAVDKISSLSGFLRTVLFKAQVFINYYIIKYPQNLSNEFFQQNFWYSLCRVVCNQLSVSDFQLKYTNIRYLEDLWTELNSLDGIDMTVAKDGIQNYSQVLATACETTATSYNNYYIENFENIICNYFNRLYLS
ncbi:hypothetical protein K501DRAFT_280465 [Backusella circina FSU 941]|nr:hypothetical protein K501DRAFT_280465 [Backusella circina FSU 941]